MDLKKITYAKLVVQSFVISYFVSWLAAHIEATTFPEMLGWFGMTLTLSCVFVLVYANTERLIDQAFVEQNEECE